MKLKERAVRSTTAIKSRTLNINEGIKNGQV